MSAPKSPYVSCSPSSIMIFRSMHSSLSLSESAGSKEMSLLNQIKSNKIKLLIQWGLQYLTKILKWASSWQNIIYRQLQSKEAEKVSETPWKWCPFSNQGPNCEIPTSPTVKKKEPKEELNPSLKILEITNVFHQRQFPWYVFPGACHSGVFLILYPLNN